MIAAIELATASRMKIAMMAWSAKKPPRIGPVSHPRLAATRQAPKPCDLFSSGSTSATNACCAGPPKFDTRPASTITG